MQYSVLFLAALAATTTLAAPTKGSKTGCDNKNTPAEAKPAGIFKVELSNEASELGRQLDFTPGHREEKKAPGGLFTKVEVGFADSEKKGDNRCQLFDNDGKPIIAVRDHKKTTTFSDDGNGAWTFENEKEIEVKTIICDPTFEVVLT
ncbi:MAG: hypothetical protein L6R35_005479, partial [Caloplaca aegaea]